MKKERALITGASSGIGLALAREFARHGHPIVLTARVESELRDVQQDLAETHGVDVQIIAQDLAKPAACESIATSIREAGEPVDILVNNAGLGQRGRFWEYPLDMDEAMIHVNIGAMVHLTKAFLPAMIQRRHGRILNTASIAGFEPGPLLATYHATKAFVLSFSHAIAVELEDSGVCVTALCPGATDTDFFPKADMEQTKAFQKFKVMSPNEVACLGYEALMRGDRVFVPGGMNKAFVFSRRLLSMPTQARFNKKLYENAPRKDRKRKRGDIERSKAPEFRKERLGRRTRAKT